MWTKERFWYSKREQFENAFLEIEIFKLNIGYQHGKYLFYVQSINKKPVIECNDYSEILYEIEKFYKDEDAFELFNLEEIPTEEDIRNLNV